MASPVKVEGLAELEASLAELGRATGKNVLRRVAKARLTPIAEAMRARAPDDPRTHCRDLKRSITVSERLSPRQRSLAGGGPKQTADGFKSDAKNGITMYAGPGALVQAIQVEFGNEHQAAQPYVRNTWDAMKGGLLTGLAGDLGGEITKAAARKAKRTAR